MSPIALPNIAPTAPATAGKTARIGSGDDFSLNELLLTADLAIASGASTAAPTRPKFADGGKALPAGQDTKRKSNDKSNNAKQEADPLFGWITAILAPQPLPAGAAITTKPGSAAALTPAATADAGAIPARQSRDGTTQAAAPAASPKAGMIQMPDLTATLHIDTGNMLQGGNAVVDKTTATPATTMSQASGPLPAVAATPAPAAVQAQGHAAQQPSQTAGQLFATVILATQGHKNSDREPAKPDSQIALNQSASSTPTDAVQASEANHQSGLDLRQDTGLKTVIDRIEMLRDNADATDTHIRLTPAGLGTVDVAVRKDGDTVHVHFAAEQPETRTLLADAQPQLNALAQERGIRLGETSIGGGGADPNRQQPQPTFNAEPAAPARAQSIQSAAAVAGRSGRIA